MDQYIHAISIRCLFNLFIKNRKSFDVKTPDKTIQILQNPALQLKGFFPIAQNQSPLCPLNLTIFFSLLTQRTGHHPFHKNISPYGGFFSCVNKPTSSSLRWLTAHSKHSLQFICLQVSWTVADSVPATVSLALRRNSLLCPKVHS